MVIPVLVTLCSRSLLEYSKTSNINPKYLDGPRTPTSPPADLAGLGGKAKAFDGGINTKKQRVITNTPSPNQPRAVITREHETS